MDHPDHRPEPLSAPAAELRDHDIELPVTDADGVIVVRPPADPREPAGSWIPISCQAPRHGRGADGRCTADDR
jgi:hypothetical protein